MALDIRTRTLSDLVEGGLLAGEVGDRLRAALRAGGDVLICGPAGSGKTALLLALLDEHAQAGERTAWIGLGAAPAYPDMLALNDGGGTVSVRSLVRSARRMGVSRIIVDDVAGDEAIELIDAMGSGPSVACTIRADDACDALNALLGHASAASSATQAGALALLVDAAPLIVQLQHRGSDGRALLAGDAAWQSLKRGG